MKSKQDNTRKSLLRSRSRRSGRFTTSRWCPKMQMGFIHNNMDCIGCRACEMACKDKNGLPPGPRFRRVQYIEGGVFPSVFAYKFNMSCNHCAEPACLPACPTGAIWKREKDGIVDIDSSLCVGCRRCEATCPFGAPQFDVEAGIVKKCNMCVDEIDAGRKPYCVAACMMRVLDVGPIDRLREGTYPTKAMRTWTMNRCGRLKGWPIRN